MAPSYTTSTEAPAEQTALKPKPVSRKVLASAGAAAFVLGNRSRYPSPFNTPRVINTQLNQNY